MSEKPTVLIANGLMDAGGTESLLMEMFRHSSGRVNYVLLVHYQGAKSKGLYDDEIQRLGVAIKHIPSVGYLGISAYIHAFQNVVKEIGHVDIVHSHLNGNGGIIAMAAKKAGIPVRICHCHADIHFTGTAANQIKENIALSVLKGFIELYATNRWACSQAAWKRLFMPWHKQIVIGNSINPRKYLSSPERKESAKAKLGIAFQMVIGSIGRVASIKNYEFIVRLLPQLPDAVFVCYGRFDESDTYCRSLLNLATELGVQERVRFMGNSSKVAEDIQSFDVFVMPSFTEGFGMAALEAQAASLPTLVSTGVPEAIDVGLGLVRFLSLDNPGMWVSAIRESVKSKTNLIDGKEIIDAFASKGKDSIAGVLEIENRYLSLCR